ncbi:uncharacterized protein I206_102249 [Kwoniella pini CBS 10737]|uniref:Uncharacterized protein n=1 Tax=Kwoniella pini CBS 10737 TaxID=1296096 RepID=A0A1B9HSZ7_9TREE|nr:uncharacterized protein I206_07619 [Kwoniella pini CBS 10737]OCF46385.1 hypothetical protein I206_07619 [Kwoniella pini CBS 10737]
MAALTSGYSNNAPSPPTTTEEKESIPSLAQDAYSLLSEQDAKMMELGDFIAELRDLDLRTAVIDEILGYMVSNNWVQLWIWKGTEETWINIVE